MMKSVAFVFAIAAIGCSSHHELGESAEAVTGSDSGFDSSSGSDSGSGSGSDWECGDGLYYLDPYSAQFDVAGSTVSLDPHSMAGTAPFTYSANVLPPGLSIDPITGRITGTLGITAYVGSPYNVTVTITDSGSPATVRAVSFRWRIDRRALPRQESTVGDAVDITLPPAPGTSPFTYAVSGLPPGLSADTATGNITGTISASTKPGLYIVSVATTGGDVTETYNFIWWVWGPSLEATSEPADQDSWEGDRVTVTLPTPLGAPGFAYAAVNLPAGLAADPATGTITGAVAPGAGTPGGTAYDVMILATSSDLIVTTFRFRWTAYSYPIADNP